jgi:septal ring factor EnvC (AmiA/AmiB activator)
MQSKTRWIFAERHGADVIQVVRRVDQAEQARKKAKTDAKKAATAARKEEEKRQKDKTRQEKESIRLKKAQEEKEAKEARVAEQARAKAEKEAAKQAGVGRKRSKAPQALEGCSTFNLSPSTPSTSQPIAGPASATFSTPTGVLLDFQVGFPFFFSWVRQ